MGKNIPWHLISAKLEGDITPEEEKALDKWLSDEEHFHVYGEIAALWAKVQKRAGSYNPDPALYWEKVAERLSFSSSSGRGKKTKRLINMNSFYKAVACVTVLVLSAFGVYYGMSKEEQVWECQYVNVNGKSQVSLPDGSVVWLHANTTLSYKTDFRKNNRVVDLEGEAYFEVVKDAEKRFIVHTDKMDVAVYGTKFNVYSRPEDNKVNVSLLDGSVAFVTETAPDERFLLPGESVSYDKESHEILITDCGADMNAAWATSVVRFENQTLRQICEVLSKRFDVQIQSVPEISDKYKYTFVLRDEDLYDALELVTSLHSIKYSIKNDGVIYLTQ